MRGTLICCYLGDPIHYDLQRFILNNWIVDPGFHRYIITDFPDVWESICKGIPDIRIMELRGREDLFQRIEKIPLGTKPFVDLLRKTERGKFVICGLKPFMNDIFPEVPQTKYSGWFDNDTIIRMNNLVFEDNILIKFRKQCGQFTVGNREHIIYSARESANVFRKRVLRNRRGKATWGWLEGNFHKYLPAGVTLEGPHFRVYKFFDKNFTRKKEMKSITVNVDETRQYYLFDHTMKGAHHYEILDLNKLILRKKT